MIPAKYILVMLTVEMVVFARSLSGFEEHDAYRVSVAKFHTVFSSNINANFSLPSNNTEHPLILQLIRLVDNNNNNTSHSLESIAVPRDATSGVLTFRCDAIQSSGRYVVRLTRNLTLTLAEAAFISDWPSVTLVLPKTQFTALAGDVEVRLIASGICINWSVFTLELCRLQQLAEDRCDVVFKSNVKRLVVVLPCGIAQRPGNYALQLTHVGDTNSGDVIARSDTIEVVLNKLYVLSAVHINDVHQCDEYLSVGYTRPRCSHIDDRLFNDKIRLYRLHQRDVFHNVMVYIAEQRVLPSVDVVKFDCELFESIIDVDAGYCFKYITQSTDGAITEQTSYCVSTSFSGSPVNGGWSGWSSWSPCTDTCRDGIQTRHRSCDSPSPSNGGNYCNYGNTLETRPCQDECTTDSSATTPPYSFLHYNDTQLTLNNVSECEYSTECHCVVRLTAHQPVIIISSITSNKSSAECPLSTHQWTLQMDSFLPQSTSVQLTIRLYQFDSSDHLSVLLIRDGESPLSDLLWSSHGHSSGLVKHIVNIRQALSFYFTAPIRNSQQFTAIISAENAVAEVTPSTIAAVPIEAPTIDFYFFKLPRLLGVAIIMASALFVLIACIIVCHDRMCIRRRRVKTSPVKDKQSPSKQQNSRSRSQQQQQQQQQGTPLHNVSQQRYMNAWSYDSELYERHHVTALHPYYDDDSTSSDSEDREQYDEYYYYKKRKVKRSATKQHQNTTPQHNDSYIIPEQYQHASPQRTDTRYQHRHHHHHHQSPGKHRRTSTPQRHNAVFISPEQYQHATPQHCNEVRQQSPGQRPRTSPQLQQQQQHNAIYLSPDVLRMFDAQFSQPVKIGHRHGTSNIPMSPLSPRGSRHPTRHAINTHSKRIKKKHKKRVTADGQHIASAAINSCPPTASLMPDDDTIAASSTARLIASTDDSRPTDTSLMPDDAATALPLTADLSDPATGGVSNSVCRPTDVNEQFDGLNADEQNAA